MNEGLAGYVLEDYDETRYPKEFFADYEAMACIAHSASSETLRVKNRRTGDCFLAKCYTDKKLISRTTEGALLKGLRHPGLPRFIAEYQNDGMLCVVREYIEGTPLDRYVSENPLTQEQSISIVLQLCCILSYLHSQTPPVIHRDIKPQNIILGAKGKITLIDFGISRVYDETARKDTVCFGTMDFAPPEQYGYSQTDCRADIFSLGVLLGWLLTEDSHLKTLVPKIQNPRLRRIVEACTDFAPERRYASVERVRADLRNADGHRKKRALRLACGFLVCAACLCAGFIVGRYTDFTPVFSVSSGISFEEPLIEQAVRLALDIPENEPIGEKELLSVTELYIYGDQAAADGEAYGELGKHMALNDGELKNGGIRSLNDLKKLKNLHILRIALQDIGDLSPLSELTSLEDIDLRHNPVEDVSPLASLPALKNLCLFETRVSDISALSACPMLENIDAGKTRITSIAAFAGIQNLKYLFIRQTTIESLSGIEGFPYLEQIGLSGVLDRDLTPLLNLPRLREAHLDEGMREEAENDLPLAAFRIIYS
ncbi:MAG: protein kinase [Bacillota bacterium]